MKLKSLIIGALLACTSCSNSSSPVRIEKIFPLEPFCDISKSEGVFSSQGYLDVAANGAQFFVGIQVTGAEKIRQDEVMVSGRVLELPDRNRPVILQQVITYRLSKRVGAAPKPYISNRSANFNGDGVVIMPLQLISPDLGEQLFDGLTAFDNLEDFVDVQVDVELKGEFNASKAPFTTGVFTYPIRAFRSNPTTPCPNGYVKFATDTGSGVIDLCSYVGQRHGQSVLPPPPTKCCTATGPAGGAGC